MTTVARPRASFGVGKADVPGVLNRAHIMYNAFLLAIALFSSPTVTMVAFLALIGAAESAQQAAKTKAKGLAAVRNSKRNLLWTAMESLRIYAQGIADTQPAEDAVATILAAGLLVAGVPSRDKALLEAKLTTTPGLVHVFANASLLMGGSKKKATFNWQMSTDGKTWLAMASTPYADIEVPNLTLLTTYWFRVSVTIGRVTGDWSQSTSVLVH